MALTVASENEAFAPFFLSADRGKISSASEIWKSFVCERKGQDCDLDRPERIGLRKPKKAPWRGVVGVVVAQLFAIQVLCANIVATQMAFDGPSAVFAICHGGDLPTNGKPSPNGHLQHAACVICTFAAGVPTLPGEETRAAALTESVAIFEYALYRFVGKSDIRTPRSSRGPPQTV